MIRIILVAFPFVCAVKGDLRILEFGVLLSDGLATVILTPF